MSIRITETPPLISGDDIQITHRGRTFGVELTSFDCFPHYAMIVEAFPQGWMSTPTKALSFTDTDILEAGGPRDWILSKFIPWLRAEFLTMFPPTTQSKPEQLSLLQQVDALLQKMVYCNSLPDGTIGVGALAV